MASYEESSKSIGPERERDWYFANLSVVESAQKATDETDIRKKASGRILMLTWAPAGWKVEGNESERADGWKWIPCKYRS